MALIQPTQPTAAERADIIDSFMRAMDVAEDAQPAEHREAPSPGVSELAQLAATLRSCRRGHFTLGLGDGGQPVIGWSEQTA